MLVTTKDVLRSLEAVCAHADPRLSGEQLQDDLSIVVSYYLQSSRDAVLAALREWLNSDSIHSQLSASKLAGQHALKELAPDIFAIAASLANGSPYEREFAEVFRYLSCQADGRDAPA